MKLTLGIDLGGTGIKVGLVDPQGHVHHQLMRLMPAKRTPAEIAQLVKAIAKEVISRGGNKSILGVGIGCAGDIDQERGIVRISPNLHWKNTPLRALLKRHLPYPIHLENDANAAAWAAFKVEAGKNVKSLLCITVGTGIGGGLVLDGKIYRGAIGSAGEVGHMTIFPDGRKCTCGNQGCTELYVGAKAMIQEARAAIAARPGSLIPKMVGGDLSRLSAHDIQKAAALGDPLANELWQAAGERLGITLASIVNLLNPEWIVLAGGLSRAGKYLLDPLQRTIRQRSFTSSAKSVKIVISKLNQDLGMVGAGLLAHEACK